MSSLSAVPVLTIGGETRNLGSFLGKATLVVNVASKCGFTPQYAGLEALYKRFKDRGFTILGFPCDQFGHQEPGDEREIQSFCTLSYQVDFPLFAKIEVNGPNAHPLYRELKAAAPGFLGRQHVKWNFTKFLLDGEGRGIKR
jgi:glutathione peroxidase